MLKVLTNLCAKQKVRFATINIDARTPSRKESTIKTVEMQVDDQPPAQFKIELNKSAPSKLSKAVHGRASDLEAKQSPFFFVGTAKDGKAELNIYREL